MQNLSACCEVSFALLPHVLALGANADDAIEKPLAYGSKAFDSIMNRARATRAKTESKK